MLGRFGVSLLSDQGLRGQQYITRVVGTRLGPTPLPLHPPSTPVALPVSFLTMTVTYSAPTCGRPPTNKALLVGISYPHGTEGNDQELDPLPTSIPNVNMFKQFIQGELSLSAHCIRDSHRPFMLDHWGYTDIVVMTDEDGVEERMQPTRANLVRTLPQLYKSSICPNCNFF